MSNTASVDHRSRVSTETRRPLGVMLARIVSFIFGVIEAFIAVRFVLELFQANRATSFVQFIYGVSDYFMTPFNAIFRSQHFAGTTIEVSALVAIVVYVLIAWGLVALIYALMPRFRSETVETVERDDRVR
jgi:uncharacterized protein YggT (Ycf19 family)